MSIGKVRIVSLSIPGVPIRKEQKESWRFISLDLDCPYSGTCFVIIYLTIPLYLKLFLYECHISL